MNEYILTIENLIRSCFLISDYQLNTNRRTQDIAYISGRIDFIEGSFLDFKEFVEKTEKGIEKYKYGYNYRNASGLMFRYDNAPDPGARHLNSFPHHKHTEDLNIIESHLVSFSEVLEEIQNRILAEWEY